MNFLESLLSSTNVYGRFGLLAAILAFIVLFLFGLSNKSTPEPNVPKYEPKELTPEEDKKEGLQTLGCLLIFFIVALIIVLWIM